MRTTAFSSETPGAECCPVRGILRGFFFLGLAICVQLRIENIVATAASPSHDTASLRPSQSNNCPTNRLRNYISQARTTHSKSASIDDRSSQAERLECSAGAARPSWELTQSQTTSVVKSKSPAGSIPAASIKATCDLSQVAFIIGIVLNGRVKRRRVGFPQPGRASACNQYRVHRRNPHPSKVCLCESGFGCLALFSLADNRNSIQLLTIY